MAHTTAQKSMSIPLTAFTAGAVVALLVGVFGRVHDPTLAARRPSATRPSSP